MDILFVNIPEWFGEEYKETSEKYPSNAAEEMVKTHDDDCVATKRPIRVLVRNGLDGPVEVFEVSAEQKIDYRAYAPRGETEKRA